MKRQLYALYDKEVLESPRDEENAARGMYPINESEAPRLNKLGFGMFQAVQLFGSETRQISNLKQILSWAVDIDVGTKEDQLARVFEFLVPSLIVETKRGVHIYYDAKNATKENYQSIVADRLVPQLSADKKAKDLARVLRVPGYFHMKNPTEPFLIKTIHQYPVAYTEEQMIYAFKLPPQEEVVVEEKRELRKIFRNEADDFWEQVYNLDCEVALNRLSGTAAVSFETYTFKRVSNGNLNIFVNGKGTSCWIDKNKRIGSMDGGGPTIYQWLKWFTHDDKRAYENLKTNFQELWSGR